MLSTSLSSSATVDVAGGQLYVFDEGDGTAVLFIHGWTLDHRAFQPQLDALVGGYRVIAPDRRGFGQSTAPADLRRETDDILALLDARKIDRTHIVGMSQGGRVAIRFVLSHPDRVHSLTLQGTAADGITADEVPEERIPLEHYVDYVQSGRIGSMIKDWSSHPMMSAFGNAEAQSAIRKMLDDYEGRDLLNFDLETYQWDGRPIDHLQDIQCPLLLITGERDAVARREIARRILNLVPDARETVIHGHGHLCNLTAPAEYNAMLGAFLDSLSR